MAISDSLDLSLIAFIGSVIGIVWTQALWLSGQFSKIRNLVFDTVKDLEVSLNTKFEYHEKHDDQRFNDIRNDLWMIRLRSAAKDGSLVAEAHPAKD